MATSTRLLFYILSYFFFHCIFFHYSIYRFLLPIEMFITYLQLKFLPKSFDYLKYLTKYVLFIVTVSKLLCSWSDVILKVHALGMTQIQFGSNLRSDFKEDCQIFLFVKQIWFAYSTKIVKIKKINEKQLIIIKLKHIKLPFILVENVSCLGF